MEDTHELRSHFKLRRAAFSKYIQSLEGKRHIIKKVSEKRASKRVLRMSGDAGKAFKVFLRQAHPVLTIKLNGYKPCAFG